jgi:hypothetical protein
LIVLQIEASSAVPVSFQAYQMGVLTVAIHLMVVDFPGCCDWFHFDVGGKNLLVESDHNFDLGWVAPFVGPQEFFKILSLTEGLPSST